MEQAAQEDVPFQSDHLKEMFVRQQREREVQLMLNRIQLLEQEEEKVRNNIKKQTHKADQLMKMKEYNEQQYKNKLRHREMVEQQIHAQKQKIKNEKTFHEEVLFNNRAN